MFGTKDPEFIQDRKLHMEAYFNEIFSEKRLDVVTSRRVMGELYAYCRDIAVSDSDKAKVSALI